MAALIPSEVWEEKRSQIARLYKDEDWPLKQVIKKLRSDNFNPTYVTSSFVVAQNPLYEAYPSSHRTNINVPHVAVKPSFGAS